jgi:uncharacterized protein (TIRG00374 family)
VQARFITFLLKFTKNPFILVTIIMVIYVAVALYLDVGKLYIASVKIDYLTLPAILIPMTLTILVLGFRFHRYLRALKIDTPLKKSILIYVTGLALAVTPAGSGQVIRSQIIKKQFGFAVSKTSPVLLIEKWNELNAALLILIGLALVKPMLESTVIIIVGVGLALFIFGIMRNQLIFSLFKKIILRFPRLKVLEESVEISRDALKALSSRTLLLEGFIFTVPAMILQAVSVFFVFHALGVKISFITSTQIFYVALISGVLSFIPGGLVVTEASMLGLLIKYYDHDVRILATSIIIIRFVTVWYPTLLGILTSQFILRYKQHNT